MVLEKLKRPSSTEKSAVMAVCYITMMMLIGSDAIKNVSLNFFLKVRDGSQNVFLTGNNLVANLHNPA